MAENPVAGLGFTKAPLQEDGPQPKSSPPSVFVRVRSHHSAIYATMRRHLGAVSMEQDEPPERVLSTLPPVKPSCDVNRWCRIDWHPTAGMLRLPLNQSERIRAARLFWLWRRPDYEEIRAQLWTLEGAREVWRKYPKLARPA